MLHIIFIQDDSGWHEVAASLAVNCDVQELGLDGCDAFLTNMPSVLTGNLSIPKHLTLWSESVIVLLHPHIYTFIVLNSK